MLELVRRLRRQGVATEADLRLLLPRIAGGAGELWRQDLTIGKEITAGTPVATTRKMYGDVAKKAGFARLRPPHLIDVMTGTRDNQRDIKLRAVQIDGTFDQPISPAENLEIFAAAFSSGVTPTAVVTAPAPAAGTGVAGAGTTAFTAGVYTFLITQWGAAGETLASPTATVTLTAGQQFVVTGPALGSGMTNTNVYLAAVGTTTPRYYAATAVGTTVTVTAVASGTVQAPTIVGQEWVFTPNSTSSNPVDSQTWEWYDGARNWQIAGVMVDELDMSGTIATDTMLTAKLFGRQMLLNAASAAPAERLPDFLEGWEAKVYIDAIGGTPGTTEAPLTVLDYSLAFKNNLGRKYFADNTLQLGEVVVGALGLQATITMEAASTFAAAEYANWDANAHRLIRLELGNNEAIGGGQNQAKKLIRIDIPAGWTAVDLTPEDAQTKVYKFTAEYIYDPVNAFGCRVTAINERTTMYA